ncbi:hypothetical protein GQ600_19552 [Phytophthora cactorum]|nr:hypothetical protein GQ600_19552 [Phytophthora cactorum]
MLDAYHVYDGPSFTCWGHYSDAWVTPGKSKSDLAESRRYVLSTAVRSVTPKQDRGGQGGPRQRRCPVDWVGRARLSPLHRRYPGGKLYARSPKGVVTWIFL